MDRRHIIPVAAANDGDPVVVVEVRQNGSHPLDVRLVGCEGENPYVTSLKQRNIRDLKKKGSDEEWEIILSHFLLQEQPEGDKISILDGVRIEYAPKGESLQITIRRHVQGIKMTLGEFELVREPEEEIDPIDWAYSSAQAHNLALREIADLRARADGEQGTIDKLHAQLEDFIKTKDETETAMLQQFMILLNEKKRKIRDQNRLLAGAKVDKSTASAVQSIREETKPRTARPSRSAKRKAPAKPVAAKEDSEADQMELDESKGEEEQDEESGPEAATPDQTTDDETDDEGGADSFASHPNKALAATGSSTVAVKQSTLAEPPPRRELPFSRPATRGKPAQKPTPAVDEDEDDETEDEEL